MAQLSRPFQIALLALGLFVAVWFVALHRPGGQSNSSSAGSSGSASSSTASGGSSAGSPSHIYHGSAPGVSGLTRDIARAHGAVAASERNAQALQSKSAQASEATTGGAASSTPTGAANSTHTGAAIAHTPTTRHTPTHTPAASAHTHAATHSLEAKVAGELKHGKVVLLLFWNSRSSDDVAVHRQVQRVADKLGGKVAVHTASAHQVGSFGSITRDIQVYQTPTLLIVNRHKQVATLTGYTEAFAIEQAVAQARK